MAVVALQVQQVLQQANVLLGLGNSIFICGDFNADESASEVCSVHVVTASCVRLSSILLTFLFCVQIEHISEVAGFSDSALANGNTSSPTWSDTNPLSVGFLRVPDERVDYIFFKAHSQHVISDQKSQVVLNKQPFTSDHFGFECVLNLELRHRSTRR